jgi:hypothetical protein
MIHPSKPEAHFYKAMEILYQPLSFFAKKSKKVVFIVKHENLLRIEELYVPIPETTISQIEAYLNALKKFGKIKNFKKHCGEVFFVTFNPSKIPETAQIIHLKNVARKRAA